MWRPFCGLEHNFIRLIQTQLNKKVDIQYRMKAKAIYNFESYGSKFIFWKLLIEESLCVNSRVIC